MKKLLRVSSVRNFTLLFSCFLSMIVSDVCDAQTLVAPSSSTSYINNYSTPSSGWQARSCCSYANAYINGSYYDLFISAWRDYNNVAHIIWRASDMGVPSTLTSTGADADFTISGTTSIQNIVVGIIEAPFGGYQAIVAYNDVGPSSGVKMNIYDVSTSGPQLITTPASTTTLFSGSYYNTRVCMDSRKDLAAIVWNETNPNTSQSVIKCLPIKNGSFNLPVLLNNTDKNINADVAISENTTAGDIFLHFISYDTATLELIERKDTFSAVYAASLSGFLTTPVVEDINSLGAPIANQPRPCIDCPSTAPDDNWGYVYCTSQTSNNLFVRLIDYSSMSTPSTINLTDGSMGNGLINGQDNTWPTLAYGSKGDNIFVAWQTDIPSTPTLRNFVCVQFSSDGTSLLSAYDYLQMSPNPTFYPNGVLLSKNSDGPSLYAISSSYINNAGSYRADHYFHYWSNPTSTFKEDSGNPLVSYDISAWPNPFTSSITLDVSSSLMNERIKASMTDILGRVIFSKEIVGRDLNDIVNSYLPKITPGNYWLNVSKPVFKYSQVLPLVKTGK